MKTCTHMIVGMVLSVLLGLPSLAPVATEPFIGEIMMFGGNFCPRG